MFRLKHYFYEIFIKKIGEHGVMKYKKSIIIIVFVIFLFAIAAVSASDVDDTVIASGDESQMEISANEELSEKNLQTNENNILAQANNEETVSVETNSEILTEGEGTYFDLSTEIGSGGDKNLTKSYYHYTGGKIIEISTTGVINGNGAIIDMNGSNIRAFYVSASDVIIKNLTIKNAEGAIYFNNFGTVANCNFINITARYDGSGAAVYFNNNGKVTNCNFTNIRVIDDCDGGAVYFNGNGTVENCNFINNTASGDGGAVYFSSSGTVLNCNFINNTASDGGAVYFSSSGTVSNCNFINNTARDNGGAIGFSSKGNITNCNFTGNNAATGSTIYFNLNGQFDVSRVSNSILLNNRANSNALEVTENNNNIIITFTGNNNFLNAIYTNGWVFFTNVTYLGANGINNTDNSYTSTKFNNEAGQNITLEIYDSDDNLVENVTLVTDDNGQAEYDKNKLIRGEYRYNVYHLNDSYYTYAEKNGTFTGGVGDFNLLQRLINGTDSVLTLDRNYTFTIGWDENLIEGILIDKPITINGNGYTIDANGKSRIFAIISDNVVLKNIAFVNGNTTDSGGAVYFLYGGTVANCNFTNSAGYDGGAVYFYKDSEGNVTNCSFTNNSAHYGGAIDFYGTGNVKNCNFVNNKATTDDSYGGAVCMYLGSVENCNFTNNNAVDCGGAVFFWDISNLTNCNFINNTAYEGGAVYFYGNGNVINCNFTGNNATTGSAIYFYGTSATKTVSDSCFLNNRANAATLEVTKNDNNITIIFTGKDNLLNAIYSRNDAEVTFTNVVYWSANGITNTGNSPIKPSRSNKEAGQNISVDVVVNGEIRLNEVKTTDDDGKIVLDIIAGENYYIHVHHDTDSYYTAAEKTITGNAIKYNSRVIISPITDVVYPNIVTIKYSVENRTNVTVTVDNVPNDKIIITNDTITLIGLDVGKYTITILNNENSIYYKSNSTKTFNVNKQTTSIVAADVSSTYNINKDLIITLNDSTGKALTGVKVSVDLNGAKEYTTDSNGQVKVSINGLTPKTYTAKITFNGNTIYEKSAKDVKITVKKANPKLTAKKGTFKKSVKVKKYTIVLKDNLGKAIKKAIVTIKVGKKTYTAKTSINGKATFKIKKLTKKGTYRATITYKGNTYYNKVTKKVNIKLK